MSIMLLWCINVYISVICLYTYDNISYVFVFLTYAWFLQIDMVNISSLRLWLVPNSHHVHLIMAQKMIYNGHKWRGIIPHVQTFSNEKIKPFWRSICRFERFLWENWRSDGCEIAAFSRKIEGSVPLVASHCARRQWLPRPLVRFFFWRLFGWFCLHKCWATPEFHS